MRQAAYTPTSDTRPFAAPFGSVRMEVATVVAHMPSSNMVSIRIVGTAGRIIQKVVVPDGVTLSADDRVLVARCQSEPFWMVVTRVQSTDEYGSSLAAKAAKNALHPPDNFAVEAIGGGLLATWDCWPGSALAFEVQWTAVVDGGYDGYIYTYGGMHLYRQESQARSWLRVRAIRYDMEDYQAFASAWTAWQGARPQVWAENVREQLDQYIAAQEEMWVRHLEGNL